jgi:hypothetical protein
MDFEKGFPSVWVYDVVTGDRRLIGGGAEAQFSPDGKWISFVHGLPGQNAQVYVQAFPGPGPRIQVSSRGGGQAQWSPDGRRLYYMAPDRKLMAVELQLRNGDAKASAPRVLFQTRITAPHIALFQFAVSPDGRFLINSLPTVLRVFVSRVSGPGDSQKKNASSVASPRRGWCTEGNLGRI